MCKLTFLFANKLASIHARVGAVVWERRGAEAAGAKPEPIGKGKRGPAREGEGAEAIRADEKGGASQPLGCAEGASIGDGWARISEK